MNGLQLYPSELPFESCSAITTNLPYPSRILLLSSSLCRLFSFYLTVPPKHLPSFWIPCFEVPSVRLFSVWVAFPWWFPVPIFHDFLHYWTSLLLSSGYKFIFLPLFLSFPASSVPECPIASSVWQNPSFLSFQSTYGCKYRSTCTSYFSPVQNRRH